MDRSLIIAEIEKILLFCTDQDTITPASIDALSSDPLGGSMDDLLDRTLLGDVAGCTNRFRELASSGIQPAQIMVVLSNQLSRLRKFRLDIEKGQSSEMVIKNARPPVFFKKQATTKRQLLIWQISMLERALAIVFEAILLTRQSTDLAESICERALITISKTAQNSLR
jgi:DNA polymerase-3 subunit delta